jgi:hypothetical protein
MRPQQRGPTGLPRRPPTAHPPGGYRVSFGCTALPKSTTRADRRRSEKLEGFAAYHARGDRFDPSRPSPTPNPRAIHGIAEIADRSPAIHPIVFATQRRNREAPCNLRPIVSPPGRWRPPNDDEGTVHSRNTEENPSRFASLLLFRASATESCQGQVEWRAAARRRVQRRPCQWLPCGVSTYSRKVGAWVTADGAFFGDRTRSRGTPTGCLRDAPGSSPSASARRGVPKNTPRSRTRRRTPKTRW